MKLPSRNLFSFQSNWVFRFFVGVKSSHRLLPAGFLALLIGTIFSAGCDKNQLSPFDSRNIAPVVRDLLVSPDSINIDNLTPTNGQYVVSINIRVAATDSDGMGSISAVIAQVIRPDGSIAADGLVLHDDGVMPDSISGDSLYSCSAHFSLTRAQAGRYHVKVSATDGQGATGNTLEKMLPLSRRNSPPWIFGLNAPDTLVRPSIGSALFFMSISAQDSDGLADIREVFFLNLDSPSQTRISLRDDGGAVQPNGITSGDSLSGDGRFSVIVQLPDTVSPRTFHFQFQATDTFGDTSASLLHSLTVQ